MDSQKEMESQLPSYDLLDGASGDHFEITKQVTSQHKIVHDPVSTLDEKIEAYEDIIDSEVGDTNLVRAKNLERELGVRQIYMKFEGGNPTGTHKDRIAFAQCMDALRRGYDTITVGTCGNYGVATALAANLAGLKCVIHIPENYHTKRINEIIGLKATIVRVAGDYENTVLASQQMAKEKEYYDGNPGGENTMLQLNAYREIAFEIYDELRDAPKVVAVPVSNGTLLAGIYRGFQSLYKRGKTSRIPMMIAGSAYKKNPIVEAWVHNRVFCADLIPLKIKETEINEPLINWHAFDGDIALNAIRQSMGWAGNTTDKRMQYYSSLIRTKEGINVLPASTAGLAAMYENQQKNILINDRFVVILTGRKNG